MQGKDTTLSTFHQLFAPVSDNCFWQLTKGLEVDKYAKKLTSLQLVELIAFAQLEQLDGLRDISNSFHDPQFSRAINLKSISFSQISRRLRSLPPQFIRLLFSYLTTRVGQEIGFENLRNAVGRIYLIDSTTISLCLAQYRWAEFRQTKGGVKLHLRLRFYEEEVLPDKAVITPARPADKTQMDALVVEEKDALNVFDRGYVDYKKFDRYCEEGIRFASRLKGNALVTVVRDLPVNADSKVKQDQIVYLGKDGVTKMKHPLRLITTEDTQGQPVVIVTNDFQLKAEELSEIYRNRWQIELFFKWIKQHLRVKHFYGKSEQAVENQLFIALITYCLMVILQLKAGYRGPLLTIKRLIRTCLYEPFTFFVQTLHLKPKRSSRGRRRIDHEGVYREVVRQVLAGEADYLNDVTYDPLVL
ncbi:IS4 family transposase ISDre1 [Neomoorella glycerini]|uniref:IS4 family transposase ISDre1 n=1 Tax=Neomoorella glycerini TaxID=55779 RepID=A0A6I5ZSW4_9FIRM|nr:IS4 family transposase [Moorella glycerini]QGP92826.1 IS4 family transposase ISDre1 [Moorella glycerini]